MPHNCHSAVSSYKLHTCYNKNAFEIAVDESIHDRVITWATFQGIWNVEVVLPLFKGVSQRSWSWNCSGIQRPWAPEHWLWTFPNRGPGHGTALESSGLGLPNTDSGPFPNLSLKPVFPYPQSEDGKGAAFLGYLQLQYSLEYTSWCAVNGEYLLDVVTTAIEVDVTITIKWPRRALGYFVTEQK